MSFANGQPQLLWPQGAPGLDEVQPAFAPTITPYLIESDKAVGSVVVCPGGGYSCRAPHEGEPIALALNDRGFSAFVCDYRVAPYKHPWPLTDAQRAIRWVRANAAALNVRADAVGILGFSAGGHLASTAGTHYDSGLGTGDEIDRQGCRPDAMILCYPVISFEAFGHTGSMCNLIGENPPEDLRRSLCNELQVCMDTPPAFIWHTADDGGVPDQNALQFALALSAQKIQYELHVYRSGPHGLGLAPQHPHIATWMDLCGEFLREIGF
jgi:acetyl esterase/lipase